MAALIERWRSLANDLEAAPDGGWLAVRDVTRLRTCASQLEALLSSVVAPSPTLELSAAKDVVDRIKYWLDRGDNARALEVADFHLTACAGTVKALREAAVVAPSREPQWQPLLKQLKCEHGTRTGGNDYILCTDCNFAFDYRRETIEQALIKQASKVLEALLSSVVAPFQEPQEKRMLKNAEGREAPRRCYQDLMVEAERAISEAMYAVEKMPADVRLTDAVVLLGKAKDKVSDFVDGVAASPEPGKDK